MLGMKNHFDISDSIDIHEVDIAGVACRCEKYPGPKRLGRTSWSETSYFGMSRSETSRT